jgi:prolipoprotein diacylglyceryl transferase
MRRVLVDIHGVRIYSYTALLYVGLVAGILIGHRVAALAGLPPDRTYVALVALTLPALAGARLLFVATSWDAYRREPARIWRCQEGGASLYGGLLLGIASSIPVLRALGVAFWEFWDVSTVTLLVGMAFTKVGCFLNGCCAGRPTTGRLGFTSPDHLGVACRRIPSQLLESLLALVLLAAVSGLWSRRPFAGAVFLGAVAVYGLARFGLELTRDTVDLIGGVKSNLVISAGLVALSACGLVFLAVR